MSKILRRPMFRGGPVDSRGTGITSGLTDKPKRGLVDEPGGYAGVTTGGDLMNKNRFSYFDPNALPGFRSVKRALPINDIFGSKDSAGMQLGNTDYLVEKGYLSDVEKPVSEMSMEELIDYQLGEKGDVFQTGKSGLEKDRPRQVKSTADLTEDELREYRTTGMTSKNEALEGTSSRPVEVIETAEDGSIKLTTDPTGNAEQKTEMSARDLVRENADLFKEFLSEGNEKKLKSARIGDASDYLLKFFEGSQREGATVGSSAAEVAKFATSKDSKTERAKAAIEKTDQTATALAINDYIAGKRSKEQIEAMLAKSDIGFAQAIALADYKKGKEDFFENLKENRKGMGSAEAIITTVQETFKKVPTVLTDKDIKQENFGLLNEENVGEYFVYPDGKVTKIDKIGKELTEVVIYTRGG